jgi:hypothetical protein
MSIQILEVALYSHDGKRRLLSFRPGAVNVIPGDSKTGKSALIDIVDYCFGSDECRVPEGIIRRAVSWFGVRLKLTDGEAFIARRCPASSASSSEECFVKIGETVQAPDFPELRQTTNTIGLNGLLTGWCGILDNIHEPPPGQRRPALSANFRHALMLCFQPQDEIIRRQQLFHKASDTWSAQALQDVFPYFLGAGPSVPCRTLCVRSEHGTRTLPVFSESFNPRAGRACKGQSKSSQTSSTSKPSA